MYLRLVAELKNVEESFDAGGGINVSKRWLLGTSQTVLIRIWRTWEISMEQCT
jgi:hypothetical protein